MAPELRKKKSKDSSISAAKPASKVKARVASSAIKRKAADDASPVAVKKSKPTKEDGRSKANPPKGRSTETKGAKSSRSAKIIEEEKDDASSSEDNAQFSDEGDEAHALAELVDTDEEEDEPAVDADVAFQEGQDVGKVPKTSKKLVKSSKTEDGEPGVVYVGRIPHGFYEHQMHAYFSQFGKINKLRISRNKKTGASKHFAFIEFAEAPVAEIVSKTMDNYVLFGHLLKVKIVPKSQIHENIWKGANKRFKKIPWNKMAGNSLKKPLTQSAWAERIAKEEKRRSERAKKLSEMGYEYEGPQLKAVDDVIEETAAIEGADEEEVPKAIEAASEAVEGEPQAAEKDVENGTESLDTELAVKKPAKASKKTTSKSSKKTKKSSKTKASA
ncbi:hypothetical protein F4779DRAFT_175419 [Xylariaceae sp. FL0662B]|nr:hypothetical protein F4779DRAFT_175419 [Xylariaceae sp. FL0662B]